IFVSGAAALVIWRRTRSDASRPQLRCAAAVQCLCVAGILSGWPLLSLGGPWAEAPRQSRLLYFRAPLPPVYTLFAALPIVHAPRWVGGQLRRRAPAIEQAAIPLAIGLLTLAAARDRSTNNPYLQPVRPTPITDYLVPRIGLPAPGATFRGRAATIFPPSPDRPGASWDAMIAADIATYRQRRNDLRFAGLWAFGIPTLQEYTQIINPGTYFWI